MACLTIILTNTHCTELNTKHLLNIKATHYFTPVNNEITRNIGAVAYYEHQDRRTMAKEVGRQHVNAICSFALLSPAAVRRTVVAVGALR